MNNNQALAYLYSLQKFGIKFGLSSTERLLSRLGDPHRGLTCLHLAGTNGKGSVGAMAEAMIRRAGYRVGFYTSPHLVDFEERFLVNGRKMPREDVIRLTEKVRGVCDPSEPPTFFEFVTVMAILYFVEQEVDLAIMETGMGGRLDATNVILPAVSVITHVSLEHTQYLGHTLTAIAGEKAGIIKPHVPVVTGERRPRIQEVFAETARRAGTRLLIPGRDFTTRHLPGGGFTYHGPDLHLSHLHTSLPGAHQTDNAALALTAVKLLAPAGIVVDETAMREGLASVVWPGRLEKVPPDRPDGPPMLLDGAHNPGAARVLAQYLAAAPAREIHLVLGIMADKDLFAIMDPLLPLARVLYLAPPVYERSATLEALAEAAAGFKGPMHRFKDVPSAIQAARAAAGPQDLVVITGSLFTVGEARAWLAARGDVPEFELTSY